MKIEKKTNYSVDTKYVINTEPLSNFVPIVNFTNGENWQVVSLNITEVKAGFYSEKHKSSWSKVVTKEHLDELVANPSLYKELEAKYRTDSPVVLAKPEYFELISKDGANQRITEITTNDKTKKVDVQTLIAKDLMLDVKNGMIFAELVPNACYKTIWRTADNKLYMEPLIMDYCGAGISNENYFLDELLEDLTQRNDVGFLVETGYARKSLFLKAPLVGNEEGINKIISDIPHYNSSDESTETFTLVYFPSQESIQKIIDWKQEYVGENKTKQILNVENLAIKVLLDGYKFTKQAQKEDAEPEVPVRKFKR